MTEMSCNIFCFSGAWIVCSVSSAVALVGKGSFFFPRLVARMKLRMSWPGVNTITRTVMVAVGGSATERTDGQIE